MPKWVKTLLSIFTSSTGSPDMGRIVSFKVSTIFCSTFGYSVFHNHQVINWTEAGAGFSAVMLGIGGLIGLKEIGVAKANALNGTTSAV
jgi:hypothetical protein